MNNLPSWIHPALIQAHLEFQEKNLGNKISRTQPLPIRNQVDGIITRVEKLTGSDKQEKIKNSPQRAPSNSINSLITFLGIELEEFKGKNVIDLGGGFGGLSKYIESLVNNITIVDPIFNEDIKKALRKNIEDQEYFIYARKESLKKDRTKSHINAQIYEGESVLEEMKWWTDYTREDFPNVERNPSYAENIVGIENESEDFVFCNYVLSKETIDIEKAVKEIARILKIGGRIVYSDYERDEELLKEFRKYFDIEIIYDKSDGIIVIGHKRPYIKQDFRN